MPTDEVRTSTAVIHLDDQGIAHVRQLPGTEETLADAQAIVRALAGVVQGHRRPLLVDMRGMKSQDRAARQYYASPEAMQTASAVALLVESRISMLIANFFITVTKVSVPTRLFTSEAEALEWLRGHLL